MHSVPVILDTTLSVPHNGRGYMKRGLRAVLSEAFRGQRLHRLQGEIFNPTTKRRAIWFNKLDSGSKDSLRDT